MMNWKGFGTGSRVFEVLSRLFPGGTGEIYKNCGRNLNRTSPEPLFSPLSQRQTSWLPTRYGDLFSLCSGMRLSHMVRNTQMNPLQ
jgi:hypothetical protein